MAKIDKIKSEIDWLKDSHIQELGKHQVNHPVRLRLPPLLNKEGS